MGGHNVLETAAGKVAVRSDHMQISPDTGAAGLAAIVTDVQYQGTYVLLGLQFPGSNLPVDSSAELSVMLSESRFAEQAYTPGQSVTLSWDAAAAHRLAPPS